jgi:hypothetical protein
VAVGLLALLQYHLLVDYLDPNLLLPLVDFLETTPPTQQPMLLGDFLAISPLGRLAFLETQQIQPPIKVVGYSEMLLPIPIQTQTQLPGYLAVTLLTTVTRILPEDYLEIPQPTPITLQTLVFLAPVSQIPTPLVVDYLEVTHPIPPTPLEDYLEAIQRTPPALREGYSVINQQLVPLVVFWGLHPQPLLHQEDYLVAAILEPPEDFLGLIHQEIPLEGYLVPAVIPTPVVECFQINNSRISSTTAATSGGLFGSGNTGTTGGLFGSNTSGNTSGGLFGSSSNTNTSGGMLSNQQQQNQQPQLSAMTRVGDLPQAMKQELETLDKYINKQHAIATTLEADNSKHDNLITSIPQDIKYLQNKLSSTKNALKFDTNHLMNLKQLNIELTEDVTNIMKLILELSTPGTRLSSFQLNDFFAKKIEKYHTQLKNYEDVVSEINSILSGLEKLCTEGFGNILNIVDVIKSQYSLFMELCETMAQLHTEVTRLTSSQ